MNAQPTLTAFCSGFGQSDTHAMTLGSGGEDERPNPHPSAGKPYGTITGVELVEMVRNPPSAPKDKARWFIPSTYAEHDARSHEAQRQHGAFFALAADIDSGNPSLDDVKDALSGAVGAVRSLIYSSRSATPENRKWRVLVPLVAPGHMRLSSRLEKLEQNGRCGLVVLIADRFDDSEPDFREAFVGGHLHTRRPQESSEEFRARALGGGE